VTRWHKAALVGNPNAGKSALFNALTGARQKIANYPGVTVEKRAGRMILPNGEPIELTDLPGSYGLTATSPDEEVTRKVILGEFAGEPARRAGHRAGRQQSGAAPGLCAGSDRAGQAHGGRAQHDRSGRT
jgi:hypothetical protein